MSAVSSNCTPKVRSEVSIRKESFGFLVISDRTPVLTLDDDAGKIWKLCDGTKTFQQIEEELSNEFDEEDLTDRVSEFISVCIQIGLMEDIGAKKD